MKRPKRTVERAAAFLLLLLTACSVGRRDVPAIAGLPESFGDGGTKPLPGRWWTAFGDGALDAAIEEGLAGSPDLAAWRDRLDQARALARKGGAGLRPALNASGDASRSASWPEEGPDIYENDYALGAAASYEIDLWGRLRAGRRSALLSSRAAGEDLRAAELSLSASIASVWYETAEAAAQVRLLEEQVGTNERMLDLVRLRFRSGLTGASDVLTQRRVTEAVRGDLHLAEARLATLRHQLAVLVGRTPRERIGTEAVLIDLPALPETGLPADLLRRRPDLRAARLDVAAANAEFAAALADRFPKISLSASGSTGGAQTSVLFGDWFGRLAANLALPLLDGGARSAEADRREAAAREAFHAYESAVLAALREVEDALAREARQGEYLESVRLQLETADALVERSRDDYLSGQADYLRVLEALTSQQALQRSSLTARRAWIQYRIQLCRALGGGWNPEAIDGGANLYEERMES
ncbi:MAG: efflux transporter outer membrane subunit [Candidatus Eisenbacteria bacterium]|nr:efflux transporter outer membrane subunit [Candidatus Eisenbacteria bacterium]